MIDSILAVPVGPVPPLLGSTTETTLSTLALQAGPSMNDVGMTGNVLLNLVGSAIGAFLTTLLVGAIMIALAPDYTQRMMARVVDAPIGGFLYGIVCLLFVLLVSFVLLITIIGIVLAIPVLVLSYVIWAVGSAIAFLAIGDRLVGHAGGWTKPLLIGAGINGLLTVTGVGGLVSFCVGAAGFGAVLRDYLQ